MSKHLLRRRDLPFQKNLKIIVGDSFVSPVFRLLAESGTEMNLSGYTITAGARVSKSDTSDVVAFTVVISGGAVTLKLTDAQTTALSAYKILYFDIKYVDPSLVKTTYVAGFIEIEDN